MYHTCTNVHIYIYKDTPLCVGICVGHVYVCVYMCVYAYVYPCMHAHASACTHTLSNIAGVLRERECFFFLHSAYREQDKQKMKTRMLYVGSWSPYKGYAHSIENTFYSFYKDVSTYKGYTHIHSSTRKTLYICGNPDDTFSRDLWHVLALFMTRFGTVYDKF